MDTTTKRFIVVPTAFTVVLALIALGFAAMSTNTSFTIASWIPTLFFLLAAVVAVGIIAYLVYGVVSESRGRKKRKMIAEGLSNLFLSGEETKERIRNRDGDAVSLANDWAEKVKMYFYDHSNELGVTRLLTIRPRQADWFVYGQFDPLEQSGKPDERTYAFRDVSIKMEKLIDLIGEFLR